MLKMYWEAFKARYLNEKGQGMVEYGLILALVAVVALGAFTTLGQSILGKINEVIAGLA